MHAEKKLGGAARVQSKAPPAALSAPAVAGTDASQDSVMPAGVKKNSRRNANRPKAKTTPTHLDDGSPIFWIIDEEVPPRSLPVAASQAQREGADTVYRPQPLDQDINPKNPRWAGFRPRWLREAEKTVRIGPVSFHHYRAHVHCMSLDQCAAFLRVDAATVAKWEAGFDEIPYAAYMALRFAAELEYLPHELKGWADFEIIGAGPSTLTETDPFVLIRTDPASAQ